MKLVNAKLYENDIKNELYKLWYEEKYQYYFSGLERYDFVLGNDGLLRSFAVLNNKDSLIGFISYRLDLETMLAYNFGAVNFSSDKLTYGLAMLKVINDCFTRYGIKMIEWKVVCGNEIEKSYDKICTKLGGHIVGILHNRFKSLNGELHNCKIYELSSEEFFNSDFYNRYYRRYKL